jgi:hypothetical protein
VDAKALAFLVFKLIVTNDATHGYKWEEVHTLGVCVLFLGKHMIHFGWWHEQPGRLGGTEKNHIYYLNHCTLACKEHREPRELASH